MISAFLKTEIPFPVMLLGDIFYAHKFPVLEAFSPCLEVIHTQQYVSTLNQGQTHHQLLVITREYHREGMRNRIEDLSDLTNRHMLGDL